MEKPKRNINVQDHIRPDGSASSELKAYLDQAVAEMKSTAYDDHHKQPPWEAFPDYKRYSMGWRMGPGEDYWHAFHHWIGTLNQEALDTFIAANPEPEGWEGFFDTIKRSMETPNL